MSNQIVRALEHGAQKLGKTLAEDAGKAVKDFYHSAGNNLKKVARNTRETDAKHEAELKKILGSGRKDLPHAPHPPGGGTRSGRGGPSGGGRGRKQVERPRESGRKEDSICPGGEPVDMATGRMFIKQTDMSLPGSLPLVFTRSFEAGYAAGRWMGPRWVCTFDERLEIDAEGVVYLGPDLVSQAYPHPEPGEAARASAGARWDLEVDADSGDYTLTDVSQGLVREFTLCPDRRTALLTSLRDRFGRRFDLAYDEDGTPLSITHSGGYRLLVTVDAGRITALRLAGAGEGGRDALLLRYGYTDGHLTSVYNSSGRPMRFANDATGRILSWTDRNDSHYVYRYDQFDRVVDEGGADGTLRFHFTYGEPDPVTGIKVHSETNALGHTTRYHVNEHAQITAQTDPLGNTIRFERDEYDRLLAETDPLGRTTRYEYDGAGDLISVTRPDGERTTVSYAGELSLPAVITQPGGAVWRHTYDETGRRTLSTDPTGALTRYSYDDLGHLASVTDALGHTTLVRCNAAGLPVEITDPTGATTGYERDAFGRTSAITDQSGTVTRLTWTTEGHPASRTSPDGATESWTYDGEGNLLAHTDQLGQVSTFEYTHFETLAARTGPDGSRTTFTHDAHMQLAAVTNALGQTWNYSYDAAGRLVGESDFNGRNVSYRLDADGRILTRTDPLGRDTRYTYDLLGRTSTKDADGRVTTYTYNTAGQLIRATNPDTDLVRTVDALGNLLTETVNGRALTHTRDILGRRTSRTTPTGHTSTWAYDAVGRPTALATPAGNLEFAYDALGREHRRTLGDRLTLASTWDTLNRLTGQTLHARQSVLQRRDYTYRVDSSLTGVDDQLTGPRSFDLDPAGRVTAVHATTWTESYAYDQAGNLTHADWPATGSTQAALGTRTYTGTQLTTAGRVRYEYDAAGRITLRQATRLSRKPDTWYYTWDAEDRLAHVTTPDGTGWRYLYDPFGRRTAKQRLADDGATVVEQTDFTWDGPTLAEQTTHAPYLPGPHTLSWDHNGLHPLTQTETITTPATADTPQTQIDRRFFAIVTDLVGTPVELVDPATETIAWHTTPTVWGHTTWPSDSTTYTPLRFPGQYFDPETRLHYNLNRYYDPETARYTTPDPLGLDPAPNPDTYVHNPHTWTDPLGLSPHEHTEPPAPRSLYHYTNQEGHDGIIASQELRPSLKANNPKDARYGDGQYLTDIEPGTKTQGQLSAAFLRVPWAGQKFTHYIEVDVSGLQVNEGRPGVFVIPNSGSLDLTGRILGHGRNQP
ncbi:HYD1 signature containing ADP-ribosyltransferase family protein [Kitasatospora sp. GP82]|uniref:HYD1 signature containing ADP-ribosyltransferase family protein n=1 Tax=Kitasatospora sp. GP82 TaxID=3035089 RepID=UPI002475EB28|nr:HYD1 signature containing ADP-ribosyltransferase family protein [Kitasatospora sp. GP82]MDH6125836.1 RHS repeat-associated protein [Kitasatospora sp. GP82]